MTSILVNAIAYQLVWFATVIGAGDGWWWAGPAAAAVFATWQLATSRCRRADAWLLVAAGFTGALLDSIWAFTGLLAFASPVPSAQLAPVWIVTLWMSFALTFNHSLAMLKSRLWLAAALGALGGPIAYAISGRAWNAVMFDAAPGPALLALGAAWAIATPLLMQLARMLDPAPTGAWT